MVNSGWFWFNRFKITINLKNNSVRPDEHQRKKLTKQKQNQTSFWSKAIIDQFFSFLSNHHISKINPTIKKDSSLKWSHRERSYSLILRLQKIIFNHHMHRIINKWTSWRQNYIRLQWILITWNKVLWRVKLMKQLMKVWWMNLWEPI